MTGNFRIWLACVTAISFLTFSQFGCGGGGGDGGGGGGGTGPDETPAERAAAHTDDGWDAFEGGNFADAKSDFEAALADVANYGEALHGLGWVALSEGDLNEAASKFSSAQGQGVTSLDVKAGLAVALRDKVPADYQGAVNAANAVLTGNASYAFEYDADLDADALRLILAQSYFALQDYDEAYDEVLALGGVNLDQGSSTFVEDLLAEIQRLGG